jgi:hypothetical protein
MVMKSAFLWDVTPCSLVQVYRRFEITSVNLYDYRNQHHESRNCQTRFNLVEKCKFIHLHQKQPERLLYAVEGATCNDLWTHVFDFTGVTVLVIEVLHGSSHPWPVHDPEQYTPTLIDLAMSYSLGADVRARIVGLWSDREGIHKMIFVGLKASTESNFSHTNNVGSVWVLNQST